VIARGEARKLPPEEEVTMNGRHRLESLHVFTAIIPARFASSRLPGKALADMGASPWSLRVAERARESARATYT